MKPLEQARGILGEHFRNYVIIVQDDENPHHFDAYYSEPYAAAGLLTEAKKVHEAHMDSLNDPTEWDWDWEEEDDDDDDGGCSCEFYPKV